MGESYYRSLTYWCDAEAEGDLRAGETTTLDVELRRGGRVRLAARAPDGRAVAAECVLVDEAGERVPAMYLQRSAEGSVTGNDGIQAGETPTEIDRALPPGRYALEVREKGYRPQRVAFEVRAGESTDVTVRLEPE